MTNTQEPGGVGRITHIREARLATNATRGW